MNPGGGESASWVTAAGARARAACIAAVLVAAALPRVWAAVWDQGIFWPDEIFQSIEQSHRFAFGYGFVPWEFQDGARSWLFPGAVGLFWKLLAALGVTGAKPLIVSAKLLMAATGLVGIYASMRVGERFGGPEGAVYCGVLGAAFPPSIVYGSRCMPEVAGGPLCVVALLLALDSRPWKLVFAGCLTGLAIQVRYQNGLVALGLLGWLLAGARRRDALPFAAATAVTAVAGGLLDVFTWGSPFHAFLAYVRFNLVEGRSAEFGVEPVTYYAEVFRSAVGAPAAVVAVGLAASVARVPGLLAIVLLYVAAHTLVPHKEFRFLMPIVPLLLTVSGIGLATLTNRLLGELGPRPGRDRERGRRRRGSEPVAPAAAPTGVRAATWVVAGALAAAMLWRAAYASFDDFGQRGRRPFSGPQPLWHRLEGVNRLLWHAGGQADLCGLGLVGFGPVWTGGYAYLHRDVPVMWAAPEEALSVPGLGALGASTNYVLTRADIALPADYTTVGVAGEAKLARRSGGCASPPASYSRLFGK